MISWEYIYIDACVHVHMYEYVCACEHEQKKHILENAHSCLHPCPNQLGLLEQNATYWVACKQRKFISQNKVPTWSGSSEDPFPDLQMATFSLYCHMGERESELNDVFFFIRALFPSWRLYPHDWSKSNYLPKTAFPKKITLGLKVLTDEFLSKINSVINR